MSITTIIIIILSVLVVVLGYTTINLMKKNERQEDIVVGYLQYLDQISKVIEASEVKIQKLDYKGSFESDDEVGFFFKGLKQIQEILNEFQLKNL
jgi:ABC-type Na+ efflux pump permease subunit